MDAIDSVLDMMIEDNAWGNRPIREGNVIIATKNPADREAFEKATTPAEKRRAACFCSVIKNHLEEDDMGVIGESEMVESIAGIVIEFPIDITPPDIPNDGSIVNT